MSDLQSTIPVPAEPALRVPATLDEALDPAWLGEALAPVGDGATITAVETVEVIKTVATKVRFAATFDGKAGTQAFCLKGLLDADEMTRMGGSTCVLEGDFYLNLAPRLNVQVPEAVAVVLTLSAEFVEEFTADGRSDHGAAVRLVLTNVHQIRASEHTLHSRPQTEDRASSNSVVGSIER